MASSPASTAVAAARRHAAAPSSSRSPRPIRAARDARRASRCRRGSRRAARACSTSTRIAVRCGGREELPLEELHLRVLRRFERGARVAQEEPRERRACRRLASAHSAPMPRIATTDLSTAALVTQSGRTSRRASRRARRATTPSANAFHTVSGYTSHLPTTIVTTSTPTARSSAARALDRLRCRRASGTCRGARATRLM